MGDVIVFEQRLAERSVTPRAERPAFFFDLSCPLSYLAGEQVERVIGEAEWVPVSGDAVDGGGECDHDGKRLRAHAERRARALRLPLVWPERFPASTPRAQHAAAHAADIGAGGRFALAAMRLGTDAGSRTALARFFAENYAVQSGALERTVVESAPSVIGADAALA